MQLSSSSGQRQHLIKLAEQVCLPPCFQCQHWNPQTTSICVPIHCESSNLSFKTHLQQGLSHPHSIQLSGTSQLHNLQQARIQPPCSSSQASDQSSVPSLLLWFTTVQGHSHTHQSSQIPVTVLFSSSTVLSPIMLPLNSKFCTTGESVQKSLLQTLSLNHTLAGHAAG